MVVVGMFAKVRLLEKAIEMVIKMSADSLHVMVGAGMREIVVCDHVIVVETSDLVMAVVEMFVKVVAGITLYHVMEAEREQRITKILKINGDGK